MRMVAILKTFQGRNVEFKEGRQYVMAEDSEYQLRAVHKDCIGMSYPIEMKYKPYKGEDLTNKKLFCWRSGGTGDMLFLIPVLQYMKEKYKNCFLRVASGCKQPLENLPEIDELYDMPFDAALMDDMDYHLMFQGILETANEQSKKKHAVDMFFDYFSIDSLQLPKEKKRPHLAFTLPELDWLKNKVTELGIKDDEYVIGIQLETSAQLRNFPKDKLKAVIDMLAHEEKTKLVLVGGPEQAPIADFFKGGRPNIITATHFTVRESIILANRYDLVLAPDSFMIQTAGALGKPLVGLYGPFPSELRMAYFKNAIGIEAKTPCTPCFKHDCEPCIKGNPSPCFTVININDVLIALDFLKNKFTGRHFNYMKVALAPPDFSEIDQYFLSADKGICFFPGFYKHPNMLTVDTNVFVKADVTDLNVEFKRESFPFVLYMEDFSPKSSPIFNGSKNLVRPGGHFIAYKSNVPEQFFEDLKKDIYRNFIPLYTKYDPVKRAALIVGKKSY